MKKLLESKEVLVMDGAMGTQLIERGLRQGEASIVWNANLPEEVRAVHKSYADAGSNCLTTNTFGGSMIMLERFGLSEHMAELNRLAVELAKDAGEGKCFVLGDIGPCGEFLEPYGDLTELELADSVRKQAEVLAEAGVNGFIVETMSDPNEVRVTCRALKDFGLPILASFTYEKGPFGFQTMMGAKPADTIRAALGVGVTAVGANCGTSLSLDDYLALGQELFDSAHGTPVLLQPNAGAPVSTSTGFRYEVSPTDFARWAKKTADLGVRLIGGCCGTTPLHIAAVAGAVRCSADLV